MNPSTTLSAEADAAAGGSDSKKNKKETETKTMSKRQRRKIVNPSNTWPQQPKIASSEARAKAYLRVAGLASSSKQQYMDPTVDINSPEVKFGRLLGGTNPRKRHEAVTKLQLYLKARCDIQNETGGISELDLLKLWKGLWFTLYLADKVPVQDELSKRLAELLWCLAGTEEEDEYAAQAYMSICGGGDDGWNVVSEEEENDKDDDVVIMEEVVNTIDNNINEESENSDEEEEEDGTDSGDEEQEENEQDAEDAGVEDDWNVRHCRGAHLASLFAKTFFRTILREWGNMDKHRVDKFYTLIRLMMQQIFRYMAVRHWNIGIIRLFNDVIFEEVLSQTPNGLRYHLIDLCLDELAQANAKAPMPLTEATFLDCLEPYFAVVQSVQEGLVHDRVINKVLLKFLDHHSIVSKDARENAQENNKIFDQVHVGTVAQFVFELASNQDTQDRYRRGLYDMHKAYMKRIKEVGRDVVLDYGSDISWGAANEKDEEEEDATVQPKLQVEVEHGQVEPKKEKKKKKYKHKEGFDEQQEHEESHSEFQQSPDATYPPNNPEKIRKQRKKRPLEELAGEQNETDTSSAPNSSSALDLEVTKDREEKDQSKKKKHRQKEKGETDEAEEHQEEEVIIRYSEQKKAAKATEAKKKRGKASVSTPVKESGTEKNSTTDRKQPSIEDSKRVSFGTCNRSKSYKASMKALKTMEQPRTAQRTPDRSILLKKGKVHSDSSRKRKQHKSAKDYF